MKNFLGFASVALGALAVVSIAQAQDSVYSVQFGSTVASSSGSAGPDPELASSFNSDTNAVTYFSVETTGINNLKDQNGNTSTIDETKTDDGHYHQGGSVSGFSNAADNALFNGAQCYGPSPDLSLQLTGLNSSDTYTLYLIFQDPNGSANTSVEATVGSTSFYAKTISNASISSYVEATGTSSGTANSADYFEFTGLTGSSSLTATFTTGGAEFDGFQLDQLAVPEPSTLCLMGLGTLGLVCFARRKMAA